MRRGECSTVLSQSLLASTRWRTIASVVLQIMLLAVIGVAFFLRAPQVSGLSMEPRIDSGEFVLINTIAFRLEPIHRGDIVAFRHERSGPSVYLKRVIGLPGESVAIRGGVVYVDDRALPEPYVRYRDVQTLGPVRVPADAYYVLGDNRANSDDSRAWGFVPGDDVIGKAVLAVWPISRAGAL